MSIAAGLYAVLDFSATVIILRSPPKRHDQTACDDQGATCKYWRVESFTENKHGCHLSDNKEDRKVHTQKPAEFPFCQVHHEAVAEQHRPAQGNAKHSSPFQAVANQRVAVDF